MGVRVWTQKRGGEGMMGGRCVWGGGRELKEVLMLMCTVVFYSVHVLLSIILLKFW